MGSRIGGEHGGARGNTPERNGPRHGPATAGSHAGGPAGARQGDSCPLRRPCPRPPRDRGREARGLLPRIGMAFLCPSHPNGCCYFSTAMISRSPRPAMRLPASRWILLAALLPLAAFGSRDGTCQDRSDLEALYWARQDSARMAFTEADVRFMDGMIGHHAQALIMSALAPTNGASPAVQTLAARITNAQR